MNFKERLDIAQKLLLEKRVPNVEHGNNMHALLRLVGVPIRPPYFYGFIFNTVFYTVSYCVALYALISIGTLFVNAPLSMNAMMNAFPPILAFCALLGVAKGVAYTKAKRKYALPNWEELHRPANIFD